MQLTPLPLFFEKRPYLIPLLISIILFIYKFQYLSYGPYWDECWVYFPAVKTMAAVSPTLMPGELDPAVYSGHPLLFLFLSSIWITLFGDSNFAMHLFPLFVSIGLLFALFYVSKNWFGIKVAAFSTILFSLQAIFISQSSFMLLEVMVGLFVMLTYYFFLKKSYLAFILCGTLALWTKESAYVLIPALIIGATIEFLFFNKNSRSFLLQISLIILVFLLGFSFFILQKMNVGWFFFPLHIGYIDLSYSMIMYKMNGIVDSLFFTQGKTYITWLGLIGFLVFLIRIKNADQKHLMYFIYFSIFVFGFSLFAAINFLSTRYLIAALPFIIISFVYFISSVFNKKSYNTGVLIILCIAQFSATLASRNNEPYDTEISYIDMVKCHTDMIRYMNDIHIKKDSEITTHFLMLGILSNPSCGYVKEPYTRIQNQPTDSTKYYIFSSIEYDPIYNEYKEKKSLKLVKKISIGPAWCELYSQKTF